MSNAPVSRRQVIKNMGLGLAAFNIVPRHVLGGPGYTPPSEKLTRAVIGVGGMGKGHLKYGQEVLAVCDVKKKHLNEAMTICKKQGFSTKAYHDFREVLARPDIDIVNIVTPPHWHGLMAIAAAEAGKDVWCEKPLTRTIAEGKKIEEVAKRNGTIFRVNTWFRFRGNFYGSGVPVKEIKKVCENKVLGWPLKVTVSAHTGFYWKINMWSGKINQPVQPVPADFDYDMWLGPAPYRPYTPHRTGQSFRGYWDYDGGGLGDMGMHYLDPVQYFLGKDETSPIKVEVDTDPQHPDAVTAWRKVTLTYADGCQIILDGDNSMKGAAYIEGPEGKIFKGFKSTIPNFSEVLKELPDPAPQVVDFYQAVKERKRFALDERKAHRSTTIVNIAKIALRLNRSLDFDPVKQVFINDDEANRYVDQPMRAPWSLNGGMI